MKPKKFWEEVRALAKQHQADEVLIYMNLMLKKANACSVPVRKQDFKARGQTIQLFDGVEEWFDRITEYAKSKSIELDHVLISSGNEEIFAGTPIFRKFRRVYASKYVFDQNGVADWPALAINYTTKTQYLFRINKDSHDLSDNASVNKMVAKRDRPVPFENMIYIGDGDTDIPCFRLVKDQGGLSIAVYTPRKRGGRAKAERHWNDDRVHKVSPAIYTPGSELDSIVKAQIDAVAARHELNNLLDDWW